ncbi:MAG: EAL domain-containing protein [Pseudomonadota bacterium]
MSEIQENEEAVQEDNYLPDLDKFRIVIWLTVLITGSIITASIAPQTETLNEKLFLAANLLIVGLSVCTACVLFFRLKGKQDIFVTNDNSNKDQNDEESGVQRETRAELVSLAYTDRLTRLGNQQRMIEKFKTLVSDRREGQKGFLVGVTNMDGMKPINDLYGFEGGDEILKQCAQRLSAAIEKDGFVFRIRGDEFGFLFPEIKDQAGAKHIGRILQEVLQAPFDLDGRTVRLSGSFGFALFPEAGQTYEGVMKNIESALYYSKRGGRGRITIFSREIEELILENARMEQALRRAIANNEVRPYFQPIISLQDGKLLGFEALARWIDADLGFVSPAKFVPLAEERGIIAALTDKLLLHAAKVAAGWPEGIFLSFNLSSVQLVDPNTAQSIISTIEKAGLPAHRLEIEVTETAMMTDPETASMIIDELHDAGIRISMDDFGTGQSSLGRLRELKLDKVKIDRAFIMAIGEDKPAEHIVRAILEMCAGLDLTVVAEGIEEMNQAESLKRYGCHAGQGFLFGKPQDEHKTMGYIQEFIGSPRGANENDNHVVSA